MSDRVIRGLANQGAVCSDDVAEACGAGGCCGGCRPAIDEILREKNRAPEIVFLPLYPQAG